MLVESRVKASDLDLIVYYDKPLSKFSRLLKTYFAFAPKGFVSFQRAIPSWFNKRFSQKKQIINALSSLDQYVNWSEKLIFSEHHLSHAASAFYASPFDRAAVLTMDGVGEWATHH